MKVKQTTQAPEFPPVDWNEAAVKAALFAEKFANEQGETEKIDGEHNDRRFWREFFALFNLNIDHYGRFQHPAPRASNKSGRGEVDFLWRGKLLVEQKGSHLDSEANLQHDQTQLFEYYDGLVVDDKQHGHSYAPKYAILCNFKRFRIFDLTKGSKNAPVKDILLHELPSRIREFEFFYNFIPLLYSDEAAVNRNAAERLGALHNILVDWKYTGKKLELLLTRLLFCCFAEDARMFQAFQFQKLVQSKAVKDDAFCDTLDRLFVVLNTPHTDRKNLPELQDIAPALRSMLLEFPYTNGNLFAEKLSKLPHHAATNIRHTIEMCCLLDWFLVSPDIFGSLFQSVMSSDDRRAKGAHYTSEANILRALNPLFLDELNDEIDTIQRLPAYDAAALKAKNKQFIALQNRCAKLQFLDPACGCGNFLVVAYAKLRQVETRIFGYLFPDKKGADKQTELGKLPRVSVHQFHGIEYDDSAAHIARLALILSEQQCNLHLEGHLQLFTAPLPLAAMPPIRHANALETPWAKKDTVYDFIIGNPPFVGSKMMSEQQRNEIKTIFDNKGGSGILDYVTGWYVLAAQYMQANPHTQTAFVSTNSITQGEQVGVLWKMLFDDYKIKINFAHQTFKWHNEASGVAAVHCVIIAFAAFTKNNKTIFEYPNINKEPLARKNIKNINSYLLSGKSVVIATRHKPITDVSAMSFGNMPLDGGNLLMTDEEKDVILKKEPLLERFIKPLVSAHEFLNGKKRWCFWLIDAQPTELKKSPELMRRIKAVKEFREASVAPSTRKFAETPQTFRDKNNPKNFILIPSTSSENRKYIPFGFFDKGEISHNSCHTVPNGDLFLFGNLTSAMHMAWVKYVCGRLKSDFRYSKDIVYNNYPFPTDVTAAKRAKVSSLAQAVLDVRAKYQKGEVTIAGEIGFGEGYTTASLADLYHALTMPQDLLKAHLALDKAVEQCYRKEAFKSDTERVEFLFERYEGLV